MNGHSFAWATFSLEVCILCLNVPMSILTCHLICTTQVIHRNLKFILVCQSGDFLLRSLLKLLFTLPARLLTGNIFWFERAIAPLQFVFFSSIVFRILLGHVIVVERVLATLLAKNYEKYRRNTFSCVWFIIVMLLVLFNSISQSVSLSLNIDDVSTTLTMVTTFAATLLSFLEIGLAAFLWRHNKQKFANYARPVELCERYQLLENVRTTLQLMPAFFLYFLLLFNSSFVQILFQFNILSSEYGQNISLTVVNMLTSLLQLLIQVAIVNFHPVLNRRFRRIFFRHGPIRIEPAIHQLPENCHRRDTEKHFELLQRFWK